MEKGVFTSGSSRIHFQKWESLLRWKKVCGFFFTIFINFIHLPNRILLSKYLVPNLK